MERKMSVRRGLAAFVVTVVVGSLVLAGISTTTKPTTRPATRALVATQEMHHRMLYPIVRVRTERTGGSGTVVYSKPSEKNKERYETYILTNYHVVDDAISYQTEWSPLLRRDEKVERRGTVTVERFLYKDLSICVGREAYDADIVTYSRSEDLALLRLRSTRQVVDVARLMPRDKFKGVHVFDEAFAVGCSLGHAPIATRGMITSLNDEIGDKSFWMSSAQIIYGNSGGAMYHGRAKEFIGIPSRVAVIGWSGPVTHMGYFIPLPRIYEWFDEELVTFIYDGKQTPEQSRRLRKERHQEDRSRRKKESGE